MNMTILLIPAQQSLWVSGEGVHESIKSGTQGGTGMPVERTQCWESRNTVSCLKYSYKTMYKYTDQHCIISLYIALGQPGGGASRSPWSVILMACSSKKVIALKGLIHTPGHELSHLLSDFNS